MLWKTSSESGTSSAWVIPTIHQWFISIVVTFRSEIARRGGLMVTRLERLWSCWEGWIRACYVQFFIYSGCVSRPVAVHQLHGHTIWWEGPLVKRLIPDRKQEKKERLIDPWFELLNSGSAVFNPTEVITVVTHVCRVGSFHFRGLKFKWLCRKFGVGWFKPCFPPYRVTVGGQRSDLTTK